MPNIKLKDGSGIEQTYNNVDTITVPLADGTGNWTYGVPIDTNIRTKSWANYFSSSSPLYVEQLYKNNYLLSLFDFSSIYGGPEAFSGNEFIEDLSSFTFTFSQSTACLNMFNNCKNLTKTPTFTNTPYPSSINQQGNYFNNCYSLRGSDIQNFLDMVFNSLRGNGSIQNTLCASNYNMESLDMSKSNINDGSTSNTFSSTNLNFSYQPTVKTYTFPKLFTNGAYTYSSNMFGSFTTGNCHPYMLSSLTFPLNTNNEPYTAYFKSSTLDLSREWGYRGVYSAPGLSSNTYQYGYVRETSNIFYGYGAQSITFTESQLREMYDRVKNLSDWHSAGSDYFSVTYDGDTRKPHLLLSRFNHTSAVNLINSLPDTSAFGTNTIKFNRYCGALTDDGGCGDLTVEEIAVAAAKGWTVTLV